VNVLVHVSWLRRKFVYYCLTNFQLLNGLKWLILERIKMVDIGEERSTFVSALKANSYVRYTESWVGFCCARKTGGDVGRKCAGDNMVGTINAKLCRENGSMVGTINAFGGFKVCAVSVAKLCVPNVSGDPVWGFAGWLNWVSCFSR